MYNAILSSSILEIKSVTNSIEYDSHVLPFQSELCYGKALQVTCVRSTHIQMQCASQQQNTIVAGLVSCNPKECSSEKERTEKTGKLIQHLISVHCPSWQYDFCLAP